MTFRPVTVDRGAVIYCAVLSGGLVTLALILAFVIIALPRLTYPAIEVEVVECDANARAHSGRSCENDAIAWVAERS
jgi:hypothetical protein